MNRLNATSCDGADLSEPGLILGLQGRADERTVGFGGIRRPEPSTTRKLVRYNGESHLMTFGVTGSGKTTGPVIANALTHPGSLISLECKGDVYAATADRRRRMGQEVVLVDLRGGPPCGGFNPLDAFALAGGGTDVIARTVAATIVPRFSTDELFWRNWGETMLTGGIGFTLDFAPPENRNLGHVYDMFNNDDVTYHLAHLADTHGKKLPRSAYAAITGFLQLPDRETRPSVLGSTQQHLMLWESEMIREVTGRTTFDLEGLVSGTPVSLYIVVPPLRMAAYAPILRLWLAGLLSAFMSRTERPKHRTLMLCDELGALGRVDAFVTASTLLRSANVQLWSFWQNPAQLDIYGADARTLVDNAGVLQFLGAKNFRMACEFSSLVGGVSPEQIMAMSPEEQLVMIDGKPPETIERFRYFEHPDFVHMSTGKGRGLL